VSRVRHAVVAAALTAGVTSTLGVVVGLAANLRNNVVAWCAVAVLIVALTTVAGYAAWASRETVTPSALAETFAALAEHMASRWGDALNHRGLTKDHLVPVSWQTFPYRPVEGRDAHIPLSTGATDVEALADRMLKRGARLIITGPAGAGKSSLLLRLADAVARQHDALLPVVVSASSWNRGDTIRGWLEQQLLLHDKGLSRKTEAGVTIARHLVTHRRVFPLIDGLDELPAEPRREFAQALRDSLAGNAPLVITYRTEEGAGPLAVPRLPLDMILVVDRVEPTDVLAALTREASVQQRDSWRHLLEDTRSPLVHALSRPLIVSMAAQIYCDDDPRRDPAELAGHTTRSAVENHILSEWLPTVIRRRRNLPERKGQRYAQRALGWLTFLARHLDRCDSYDLRWWELRRSVSRPAILLTAAGFVAVLGIVLGTFLGWQVGFGVAVVAAILAWSELGETAPPGKPQRLVSVASVGQWGRALAQRARSNLARPLRHVLYGVGGAVIVVGALGLGWWLYGIIPDAEPPIAGLDTAFQALGPVPLLAMIAGGAAVLFFLCGVLMMPVDDVDETARSRALGEEPVEYGINQPAELDVSSNPRRVLGADRRWSLLMLTSAVAFTVISVSMTTVDYHPFAWIGDNAVAWAVLGVVVMSVGAFARAEWPWFLAARVPLTLAGRVPARLVTFLDTMTSWDIIRRDGDVYRFRHATVRDWLLQRTTAERIARLTPEQQKSLRRLTLHPGPTLTDQVVATICGIPVAEAGAWLDVFADSKLLTAVDDRYRWTTGSRSAVEALAAQDETNEPPGLRERVRADITRHYRGILSDEKRWQRIRAEVDNILACIRVQARDGHLAEAAEMAVHIAPHLLQWRDPAVGGDLLRWLLEQPLPPESAVVVRYWLARSDDSTDDDPLRVIAQDAGRIGDVRTQCLALADVVQIVVTAGGDNADEVANTAARLAATTGSARCEAAARLAQARAYATVEPDRALNLCRRSEALARQAELKHEEAHAHYLAGCVHRDKNDGKAALASFRESVRLFEEAGSIRSAAATRLDLGYTMLTMNMPAKAQGQALNATGHAMSLSDDELRADAYLLHGRACNAQRDVEGAAHMFRLATEVYATIEHAHDEAESLSLWGESLCELARDGGENHWATAAGHTRLLAARQKWHALGEHEREAAVLMALGKWTHRTGDSALWLAEAIKLSTNEKLRTTARTLLADRTGGQDP
jgi:hypothetical protein